MKFVSKSGKSRIKWMRFKPPRRRRIQMSKYAGKLKIFSRTNKYKKSRAARFQSKVKSVM